jgi:O-antigen ligase
MNNLSASSINFELGFILKIINAILFVNIFPAEKFKRIFIKQIFVLSFISLVFYFSFLVFPGLMNRIPALLSTDSYVNYLIYVHHPPLYAIRLRNYSIFSEPGVYQAFLNVALLFLIMHNEPGQEKKILLGFSVYQSIIFLFLVIAILTTFSTTGYIALMLNFAILLFKKFRFIFVFPFATLLIVGLISSTYFHQTIYEKIVKTKNSSTERRGKDVELEWMMFLTRPVLGYGYTYFDVKKELLKDSKINEQWTGSTNSIFYHAAMYGFIFMIAVLYGFYRFSFLVSDKIFVGILIFSLFLFLLIGETFLQKMLFLVIGFYGISIRKIHQVYYQ